MRICGWTKQAGQAGQDRTGRTGQNRTGQAGQDRQDSEVQELRTMGVEIAGFVHTIPLTPTMT